MKKWQLKEQRRVFSSKWISINENDYILPDGSLGKDYYEMIRPDYVLIVATTPEGLLVTETNYRFGIDDFTIELPAGWIEENEEPVSSAERELLEETGYVGKGEYLGHFFLAPAYSKIKGHVVRILDARITAEPEQKSDEQAQVELYSTTEVKHMIRINRIKEIGMIAALNLAGL